MTDKWSNGLNPKGKVFEFSKLHRPSPYSSRPKPAAWPVCHSTIIGDTANYNVNTIEVSSVSASSKTKCSSIGHFLPILPIIANAEWLIANKFFQYNPQLLFMLYLTAGITSGCGRNIIAQHLTATFFRHAYRAILSEFKFNWKKTKKIHCLAWYAYRVLKA